MEESCVICYRQYETKTPSTHEQLVRFVLHSCPSCADTILEQFPSYDDFPTDLRENILREMKEGFIKPVFTEEGKLVHFEFAEMPPFIR